MKLGLPLEQLSLPPESQPQIVLSSLLDLIKTTHLGASDGYNERFSGSRDVLSVDAVSIMLRCVGITANFYRGHAPVYTCIHYTVKNVKKQYYCTFL